jgi:hypothetical protein
VPTGVFSPILKHLPCRGVLTLIGLFSAAWFLTVEGANAEVVLAPHRAVYRLDLIDESNRSTWSTVAGRMVYELTGSSCAGYQQQFRQMIFLANAEGGRQVLDDFSSLTESSSSDRLEFQSKTIGKDEVTHRISGEAQRDEAGISVRYFTPFKAQSRLPKETKFPITYTKMLIAAAIAGQSSLDLPQFDGSDEKGVAQSSLAIIGPETKKMSSDEAKLVESRFGKQRVWPVSIGFGYEGQEISDYSIQQDLFENGVAVHLILDLNDFKLQGHLQELTKLEEKPCN